jgi:hypothetical protein
VEIEETEALEPGSLREARQRMDWELWKKAMEEELTMLGEAGMWELVDTPDGANIETMSWVSSCSLNNCTLTLLFDAMVLRMSSPSVCPWTQPFI